MHTLVAIGFLKDSTGAFAIMVVGDASGRPQWTTVSYAQSVANRIVGAVDMQEGLRAKYLRTIARHCSAHPEAGAIDIMGAGGRQIAEWMMLGIDAAPDGEPVCAPTDWHLSMTSCWSSNVDGLTFVLSHDAPRNRFLAALVDGRDGLPTRYQAAAVKLYETRKNTDGIRVGQDVLLLPETVGGVCALGYATQTRAKKEQLWRVTRIQNGRRDLAVLVYKNAAGPCGLRFTDDASRLRAWIRAASNLDVRERKEAFDLADNLCHENGGHACILGGEGGGEAALAFVVGVNVAGIGLPVVADPLTVHVPVSFAGRSGRVLALRSSRNASDNSAALVPNDGKTLERYLKTGVRENGSIRVPDSLARILALGFRQSTAAAVD